MSSRLPGFRFYPTEQELVQFYLRNKLENRRPEMERIVPVVDVYKHDPAELPQMSGEESVQDPEQWFFFCPRQEKEAHGGRPNRTTPSGYWKATGSPSQVFHNNQIIGRVKTMVFYQGRAPFGRKTSWKMNEYKAYDEPSSSNYNIHEALQLRSEFSLCRVYKKTGCLRSFDRRPTVEPAGANAGDVDWRHTAVRISSSCENPAAAAAVSETERSHGSSPPSGEQDLAGEGIEEMALKELWDSMVGNDGDLM